MKISEVKGCVKTLIKKGVIPELDYNDSALFTYSEERIRNEIDEIMKRNSPSHINNFIDGNMLDKTPSIDAQSKQKVKRIWTKIHDVNWKSWKYVRVRSINVHLRDIIDLLGDPSLVSFMYNQGWSDDTVYEVYRKAIISYVYSNYRPEKNRLIKIIQIMIQMMCVDILGEDILVDEAYTKQIISKESYPWNFLSAIDIDIQDCFDIKNDIRDDLTLTIEQDIDLEPRDVECIKLRYIDMLTLSDIGTQLGVCGGRAQEIVGRAVRRICRHPGKLNIIRNILYRYSDDICKQAFVKLGYSGFNVCGPLKVLHEIKEYKHVNTWRELVSIVEGNTVYFRSFRDGSFLGEIEKLIRIANRVAMEENTEASKVNVYAALALEQLGLSVRSFNCLKRAGVNTVGDIISMTEEDFMRVKNLGKRSRDEIISAIEELGLKLKDSE